MKTYSNLSNAKRAAKSQGLNIEDLDFLKNSEGKFFWTPKEVEEKKTKRNPKSGTKIQKDREERNGITRPSIGGKCAAVWELCDKAYREEDLIPNSAFAKRLVSDHGWNLNMCISQCAYWRKFMGFCKSGK